MPVTQFLQETSGGNYFPFPTIGTHIEGTVIDANQRQATDLQTGDKKTWDDGNPMYNVVVTIATTLRDPAITGDDGTRDVWIKWWGQPKTAMWAALRAVGESDIEAGAYFSATYVADAPSSIKGGSPAKQMQFAYKAPSKTPVISAEATNGIAPGGVVYAPGGGAMQAIQETFPMEIPSTQDGPTRGATPAALVGVAAPVATAPTTVAAAPASPLEKVQQIRDLAAAGFSPEEIHATVPTFSVAAITAVLGA